MAVGNGHERRRFRAAGCRLAYRRGFPCVRILCVCLQLTPCQVLRSPLRSEERIAQLMVRLDRYLAQKTFVVEKESEVRTPCL